MSDEPAAAVRVRDLHYEVGTAAGPGHGFRLTLDRMVVTEGAAVAVIGPSGCGKTTLLNLIAGVLTAGRGEIEVAGVQVDRLSETARRRFRREQIGFVFQEFELLEHLLVRENILLPFALGPSAVPKSERETRLQDLSRSTGIERLLRRKPKRLSQGERQRVALCRALITEPRLVLADEPTGNLDPDSARRSLDLLLEQVKRRGATLLVVTHDHSLLSMFDATMDLSAALTSHGSEAAT